MAQDDQRKVEKEVEELAEETGRKIGEADPETQQELRDSASAAVGEGGSAAAGPGGTAARRRRRPLNPLALGILVVLIGAGFLVFIPPVGLVLVVCGLIGMAWGAVRTFFMKA